MSHVTGDEHTMTHVTGELYTTTHVSNVVNIIPQKHLPLTCGQCPQGTLYI